MRYCYFCRKDTQTVQECCFVCHLSKTHEITDERLDSIDNGVGTASREEFTAMAREIKQLHSLLARFADCPPLEDWNCVNISVGGGEAKAKRVVDWITKVVPPNPLQEESK